ncbi:keratin, type I cytoskeletal 19 [Platysternon megacephalum]|uniref:Keratin, type I cytoskeletal 19 n=1 Tax=Platysternon megacephalum TaxID=55544 RepID=A0A4D9EV93_9SAUR|nr:keratin, type I cytoskeletal 19 [Platysternon megacephalum]
MLFCFTMLDGLVETGECTGKLTGILKMVLRDRGTEGPGSTLTVHSFHPAQCPELLVCHPWGGEKMPLLTLTNSWGSISSPACRVLIGHSSVIIYRHLMP